MRIFFLLTLFLVTFSVTVAAGWFGSEDKGKVKGALVDARAAAKAQSEAAKAKAKAAKEKAKLKAKEVSENAKKKGRKGKEEGKGLWGDIKTRVGRVFGGGD